MLWGGQVNAALPNIFANQSGNVSASELDTNYNAVAAMGTTQCTATGTNTITLVQNANQTTVSAYANYQQFSFVAANTTTGTGTVTVTVNGIGALSLYLPDSVTAAGSGTIVANRFYVVAYNSALNSGSGGFVIVSAGFTTTNGTVNAGTSGQVAYYATSSNEVSGESQSTLLDSSIGNTAGTVLCRGASTWGVCASNYYQATPSNPTGTTSTTGLQMGLAGALTPALSGNVMAVISGDVNNSAGGSDECKMQIRYGTGSPPANGAALTGLGTIGGLVKASSANNNLPAPFSLNGIINGLTPSTAYWFDMSLAAITGGTCTAQDISVSLFEVK